MYRDNENPYMLEERLNALRKEYKKALDRCDKEQAEKLAELIEDLVERIRFAWADQEADEYDY